MSSKHFEISLLISFRAYMIFFFKNPIEAREMYSQQYIIAIK